MGASFFFARWDLGSADREMLRAISIDPRNGELYSLRSYLLLVLNRPAEAIDSAKKAMELDPFSRPYALALIYTLARRYDEALADFRLRFEASPDNPNLLGMEMDTWLRKGNYKEAVNVWAKWHIVTGDPESAANLRRTWEQGGAHGFVRWQLGRRLMQSKSRYVSPVELASYYAQLGDPERTLAMLEEGYRQRSPDILFIQGNPAYDFLHGDPRYRSLLQKAGVPPTY
jgi:tetratricopeptide (TPR) repeat protein